MKDYEVTKTEDTITYFALFAYCDPTNLKNIVKEAKWWKVMSDEIDVIERNDRDYVDSFVSNPDVQTSKFQAYMKPYADEGIIVAPKKQTRIPKKTTAPLTKDMKSQKETTESRSLLKKSQCIPKKKKGGKVFSLAETAKGSVVFQQGKPCSCQTLSHKLVSNCLSCGKIVCE